MESQQPKFYSINSFMKYVTEKETDVEYVELFFIPAQTFKNQFNNTTIKPVAMLIKTKDNVKSLKYNDMISYTDSPILLSFKVNGDRRIYKKQTLQKLIIFNKIKQHKEYEYFESKIIVVTDKTVIDKITKDIPESTSVSFNDNVELFE